MRYVANHRISGMTREGTLLDTVQTKDEREKLLCEKHGGKPTDDSCAKHNKSDCATCKLEDTRKHDTECPECRKEKRDTERGSKNFTDAVVAKTESSHLQPAHSSKSVEVSTKPAVSSTESTVNQLAKTTEADSEYDVSQLKVFVKYEPASESNEHQPAQLSVSDKEFSILPNKVLSDSKLEPNVQKSTDPKAHTKETNALQIKQPVTSANNSDVKQLLEDVCETDESLSQSAKPCAPQVKQPRASAIKSDGKQQIKDVAESEVKDVNISQHARASINDASGMSPTTERDLLERIQSLQYGRQRVQHFRTPIPPNHRMSPEFERRPRFPPPKSPQDYKSSYGSPPSWEPPALPFNERPRPKFPVHTHAIYDEPQPSIFSLPIQSRQPEPRLQSPQHVDPSSDFRLQISILEMEAQRLEARLQNLIPVDSPVLPFPKPSRPVVQKPKPTQPKPTQPKPIQPKPIQPKREDTRKTVITVRPIANVRPKTPPRTKRTESCRSCFKNTRGVYKRYLKKMLRQNLCLIFYFLLVSFARGVAGLAKLWSDCEEEYNVALYSLVKAILGGLFHLAFWILVNTDVEKRSRSWFIQLWLFVHFLFSAIWLLIGTAWVYGKYANMKIVCPSYDDDWNFHFINFILFLTTLDWIGTVAFFFVSAYYFSEVYEG